MLLELAVGDAYGACFEYAPPEFVTRHNGLGGYPEHPAHLGLGPGHYTDDTQLSLAITELLVSGTEWTHVAVADSLVAAFRRDPRVGYSKRMLRALSSAAGGAQLIEQCRVGSDRSGAAMRSAPIGLLPDLDRVLSWARIQAEVTHNTAEGIASAQAVALAQHYVSYRLGPVSAVADWVGRALAATGSPIDVSSPWHGPVGALGSMSTRAALTAVSRTSSMSELLRRCVAYTGDVDTVAAIALAIGSGAPELTQDLPPPLVAGLENGRFGRDHIAGLDRELARRFPRP